MKLRIISFAFSLLTLTALQADDINEKINDIKKKIEKSEVVKKAVDTKNELMEIVFKTTENEVKNHITKNTSQSQWFQEAIKDPKNLKKRIKAHVPFAYYVLTALPICFERKEGLVNYSFKSKPCINGIKAAKKEFNQKLG